MKSISKSEYERIAGSSKKSEVTCNCDSSNTEYLNEVNITEGFANASDDMIEELALSLVESVDYIPINTSFTSDNVGLYINPTAAEDLIYLPIVFYVSKFAQSEKYCLDSKYYKANDPFNTSGSSGNKQSDYDDIKNRILINCSNMVSRANQILEGTSNNVGFSLMNPQQIEDTSYSEFADHTADVKPRNEFVTPANITASGYSEDSSTDGATMTTSKLVQKCNVRFFMPHKLPKEFLHPFGKTRRGDIDTAGANEYEKSFHRGLTIPTPNEDTSYSSSYTYEDIVNKRQEVIAASITTDLNGSWEELGPFRELKQELVDMEKDYFFFFGNQPGIIFIPVLNNKDGYMNTDGSLNALIYDEYEQNGETIISEGYNHTNSVYKCGSACSNDDFPTIGNLFSNIPTVKVNTNSYAGSGAATGSAPLGSVLKKQENRGFDILSVNGQHLVVGFMQYAEVSDMAKFMSSTFLHEFFHTLGYVHGQDGVSISGMVNESGIREPFRRMPHDKRNKYSDNYYLPFTPPFVTYNPDNPTHDINDPSTLPDFEKIDPKEKLYVEAAVKHIQQIGLDDYSWEINEEVGRVVLKYGPGTSTHNPFPEYAYAGAFKTMSHLATFWGGSYTVNEDGTKSMLINPTSQGPSFLAVNDLETDVRKKGFFLENLGDGTCHVLLSELNPEDIWGHVTPNKIHVESVIGDYTELSIPTIEMYQKIHQAILDNDELKKVYSQQFNTPYPFNTIKLDGSGVSYISRQTYNFGFYSAEAFNLYDFKDPSNATKEFPNIPAVEISTTSTTPGNTMLIARVPIDEVMSKMSDPYSGYGEEGAVRKGPNITIYNPVCDKNDPNKYNWGLPFTLDWYNPSYPAFPDNTRVEDMFSPDLCPCLYQPQSVKLNLAAKSVWKKDEDILGEEDITATLFNYKRDPATNAIITNTTGDIVDSGTVAQLSYTLIAHRYTSLTTFATEYSVNGASNSKRNKSYSELMFGASGNESISIFDFYGGSTHAPSPAGRSRKRTWLKKVGDVILPNFPVYVGFMPESPLPNAFNVDPVKYNDSNSTLQEDSKAFSDVSAINDDSLYNSWGYDFHPLIDKYLRIGTSNFYAYNFNPFTLSTPIYGGNYMSETGSGDGAAPYNVVTDIVNSGVYGVTYWSSALEKRVKFYPTKPSNSEIEENWRYYKFFRFECSRGSGDRNINAGFAGFTISTYMDDWNYQKYIKFTNFFKKKLLETTLWFDEANYLKPFLVDDDLHGPISQDTFGNIMYYDHNYLEARLPSTGMIKRLNYLASEELNVGGINVFKKFAQDMFDVAKTYSGFLPDNEQSNYDNTVQAYIDTAFKHLEDNRVTAGNLKYGCTDPAAFNYDPNAIREDGTCIAKVFGCTDPTSQTYDENANTDDGSCEYYSIDPTIVEAVYVCPEEFVGACNIHDGTQKVALIRDYNDQGYFVFPDPYWTTNLGDVPSGVSPVQLRNAINYITKHPDNRSGADLYKMAYTLQVLEYFRYSGGDCTNPLGSESEGSKNIGGGCIRILDPEVCKYPKVTKYNCEFISSSTITDFGRLDSQGEFKDSMQGNIVVETGYGAEDKPKGNFTIQEFAAYFEYLSEQSDVTIGQCEE